MKLSQIRICRECKPSHHKIIKNAKSSILENPDNAPSELKESDSKILDDYVHRNIIKKPKHFGKLARMAVVSSKVWRNGRVLSVSFFGGDNIVRERIEEQAKKWMEFANIEFDFISETENADVRINFDPDDGSWSYTGTEILNIPKDQPTMNFGWLTRDSPDDDYQSTVLHEFGHTLGCIHEHSNPIGGIPWNKEKALKYYMDDQGWSEEEVEEQVFKNYDRDLIRGTEVDKASIMMYPIPNEITIGEFHVDWNIDLSENDKLFIAKTYPK